LWQAGLLNLSRRARHQKYYTSKKQENAGISLGHGAAYSGTAFLEGFDSVKPSGLATWKNLQTIFFQLVIFSSRLVPKS